MKKGVAQQYDAILESNRIESWWV